MAAYTDLVLTKDRAVFRGEGQPDMTIDFPAGTTVSADSSYPAVFQGPDTTRILSFGLVNRQGVAHTPNGDISIVRWLFVYPSDLNRATGRSNRAYVNDSLADVLGENTVVVPAPLDDEGTGTGLNGGRPRRRKTKKTKRSSKKTQRRSKRRN